MWDAIRRNRRRSVVLVSLMGAVLVGLGFVLAEALGGPGAGPVGALGAAGLWLILWLVAALGGDHLLLATAGAVRVEKQDAPQLANVVEEMVIASGLGRMPEVYVVNDPSPNAFAVERGRDRCAVAVTRGLLRELNRDELQGVIGHEIGHIVNRDSSFMTLAGVMLGSIVLLSEVVLRGMRFAGRGRRSGGAAGGLLVLVALLAAILAPLLARLLYFACSRRREFLADACSARFTRYPEGLASALERIEARAHGVAEVSRALAPMYIINPLQGSSALALLSSHPSTEDRVRILRSMGGMAGYAAYEDAFRRVRGRGRCIDGRTLASDQPMNARGPSVTAEAGREAVARAEEAAQALGRSIGLLALTCPCGLGIQIPPRARRESVHCPRCGRDLPVPTARPAGSDLVFVKKGSGWDSFRCACGAVAPLSPTFAAPFLRCNGCGRKIRIERES